MIRGRTARQPRGGTSVGGINTFNSYFSGEWTSTGDRPLATVRPRSAPQILRNQTLTRSPTDDPFLHNMENRLVRGNMDDIARESRALRQFSRNADVMADTSLYDLKVQHNRFTRGRQSRRYRSAGAAPASVTETSTQEVTAYTTSQQRMRTIKETLEEDLKRQCARLDAYEHVGIARPSKKGAEKSAHVDFLKGIRLGAPANFNGGEQGGAASAT